LAAIFGREKWAKIGLVEKRKNRAALFQVQGEAGLAELREVWQISENKHFTP
jgi:hypothetical protein